MSEAQRMVVAMFLYLLAIGCWLGGIVFFSFIAAPVVFSRLPIAEAGRVINGIFPLYHMLGYVAGLIALVLAVYFAVNRAGRGWWSGAAILLGLALGLTVYAGIVVRPKVHAIRSVVEEPNPDPVRRAEFDALHRLSVEINGAVLVLNLLALASTAAALTKHA